MLKTCTNCNEIKKLEDFHKSKSYTDGHCYKCKKCAKKGTKKWYKLNTTRSLNATKNWIKSRPHKKSQYNKKYNDNNKERKSKHAKIYYVNNEEKMKDSDLRTKYGISLNDFKKLLIKQKNRCAICIKKEKVVEPKTNKPRRLAVDHCHNNGKVRGLLCLKCNIGLGAFADNVNLLKKAIKYLRNK